MVIIKKINFIVPVVVLILIMSLLPLAVGFTLDNKHSNLEYKNNEDNIWNKFLLRASYFTPLIRPKVPIEKYNLCTEKSTGFVIKISTQNILPVFKRDGSLQCEENKEIPIRDMKKNLNDEGIKVFKSAKGYLSQGRGLAVCGSPTNNINIFYIPSNKVAQAINQGFQSCIY